MLLIRAHRLTQQHEQKIAATSVDFLERLNFRILPDVFSITFHVEGPLGKKQIQTAFVSLQTAALSAQTCLNSEFYRKNFVQHVCETKMGTNPFAFHQPNL